jgi:lipopolysaccharide/colanic/teichoic acid biosynthesis glycosyltransferase
VDLQRKLKRALDLAVAGTGLVALAPVIGGIAGAIRATMGSPVFFRQTRPGYHGKPFELMKFRTMIPAKPGQSFESDGVRMTRLGGALRKLSLDELPTLWNVFRGEMSLVGPRPLLMQYLERYTPEQARRHDAPPGITGWAQIHGRNALDWEEKFALDCWYVDHQWLGLDLYILARTVVAVLRREGIAHEGSATMPPFLGTRASTAPAD